MKTQLLYFSPTHTTQQVLRSIQEGLAGEISADICITTPADRQILADNDYALEGDIIIVGLPVYGSKPPSLVLPVLKQLQGQGKALIIIGVYGNVKTTDFLSMTWSLFEPNGFKLIAAAEFIGEHSFSGTRLTLGLNRPDAEDLKKAVQFGQDLRKKIDAQPLNSYPSLKMESIPLPEYNNGAPSSLKSPVVNLERCIKCGVCSTSCPTGAINPEDFSIQEDKCIGCFACAKLCASQARSIEFVEDSAFEKYNKYVSPRQEPKYFM